MVYSCAGDEAQSGCTISVLMFHLELLEVNDLELALLSFYAKLLFYGKKCNTRLCCCFMTFST